MYKSPYSMIYNKQHITEAFSTISNCLSHLKSNYKKKECTKTPNDENNCKRVSMDEMIIKLNRKFSTLRCMEYSQKNNNIKSITKRYNKARPILIELYEQLYETDDINSLSYYQEFMREFYQRYIYYYPVINEATYLNVKNRNNFNINDSDFIPIYSYVKNNNCIIPLLKNKIKADLIHFDTHSDHREFDKFIEYDEIIKQDNVDIERLQQITYDIACFSSYYIHYSKTNFFWITPQWVTEQPSYEKKIQKIIKNPTSNKAQYITVNPKEKDAYIAVTGKLISNYTKKNNVIETIDKDDEEEIKIAHFDLLSTDMNNDFILSLDLDYFCTNGLLPTDLINEHSFKTKKNIMNEADQASYGRTRIQTEFTNPYYYYYDEEIHNKKNKPVDPVNENTYNGVVKNSKSYVSYIYNLRNEMELIENRINVFKQFLYYIKEIKKINPIMVLISDSTAVHLSTDNESVSLTNDFCPQNLIMFVRQLTFEALQEVYSLKKEQIEFMQFPEI